MQQSVNATQGFSPEVLEAGNGIALVEVQYVSGGGSSVFKNDTAVGSGQPVRATGVYGGRRISSPVACPGPGTSHAQGEIQSSSGLSRSCPADEHYRHGQAIRGGCAQWNRKEHEAGGWASTSGECRYGRDEEMEVRAGPRRKHGNRGVQVPAPGLKGITAGLDRLPQRA